MSADLHVHTTASDGRYTIPALLTMAEAAGLTTLAVTDHDTVAALTAWQAQGGDFSRAGKVRLIPGLELSIDLPEHEVHILGYFLRLHDPVLTSVLERLTQSRNRRVSAMVEKLHNLGYCLSYQQVQAIAGPTTAMGRPHVAQALVDGGYASSVDEVFRTLLRQGGPAYVPHEKLSITEAIKVINHAGGIAVLAHPGLIGSENIVNMVIGQGIQGLEVYHTEHTAAQTAYYLHLAHNKGLAVTGGSDFHGIPGKPPAKLGDFSIPSRLVTQLERARSGMTNGPYEYNL